MADIGGLIGSAAKPVLETLASMAVGGARGAAGGRVDMSDWAQYFAEEDARKRNRANLQAIGRLTGMPEEKIAQLPSGLNPEALMPQYQITPGGEVAEFGAFQPPHKVEGLQFAPKAGKVAIPRNEVEIQAYGMLAQQGIDNPTPEQVRAVLPKAEELVRDLKRGQKREDLEYAAQLRNQYRPPRVGDHYDQNRIDKKEAALGALLTQRQNLIAGALLPSQLKTRSKLLPALDARIEKGISELPPDLQEKWRGLFSAAQQTTAPPTPPPTPPPAPTPGVPGYQKYLDMGKSFLSGGGPAATPTPSGPKILTPELAAQYLNAAGGNKDRARAAARADGYQF